MTAPPSPAGLLPVTASEPLTAVFISAIRHPGICDYAAIWSRALDSFEALSAQRGAFALAFVAPTPPPTAEQRARLDRLTLARPIYDAALPAPQGGGAQRRDKAAKLAASALSAPESIWTVVMDSDDFFDRRLVAWLAKVGSRPDAALVIRRGYLWDRAAGGRGKWFALADFHRKCGSSHILCSAGLRRRLGGGFAPPPPSGLELLTHHSRTAAIWRAHPAADAPPPKVLSVPFRAAVYHFAHGSNISLSHGGAQSSRQRSRVTDGVTPCDRPKFIGL